MKQLEAENTRLNQKISSMRMKERLRSVKQNERFVKSETVRENMYNELGLVLNQDMGEKKNT